MLPVTRLSPIEALIQNERAHNLATLPDSHKFGPFPLSPTLRQSAPLSLFCPLSPSLPWAPYFTPYNKLSPNKNAGTAGRAQDLSYARRTTDSFSSATRLRRYSAPSLRRKGAETGHSLSLSLLPPLRACCFSRCLAAHSGLN